MTYRHQSMFYGASAWLASYVRVDGSSSVDGPPSAWARPSPPATPPSSSSPSGAPAPFTSRGDLKTAVDNCLAFDPTGVQCCGSAHDANCSDPTTARCGVAGCDEMPLWDTSSVWHV
jgi:hypothetical protein